MRILLLAFLFPLWPAAGSRAAETKTHDFPPGVVLRLPAFDAPKVEWVWASEKPLIKEGVATRFDVDRKGTPWFSLGGKYLLSPLDSLTLKVDPRFADFAYLDVGELVVSGGDALGYLVSSGTLKGRLAPFHFKPMVQLPMKNARLFPGSNRVLYVAGRDIRSGKEVLYLFQPPGPAKKGAAKASGRLRKLLSVEQTIGAADGDGTTTYLAMGRLIAVAVPGQKALQRVFLSEKDEITGLGVDSDGGLFFSTPAGVYHLAKGAAKAKEFIKASDPQIRLVKGELYVMLGSTKEVLKLANLQGLRR